MRADKSASRPEAEQYLAKQRGETAERYLPAVTQGAVDQGRLMCSDSAAERRRRKRRR